MITIDVGKEFHSRLAHRNEFVGDFHAVEFRKKYLSTLDNAETWKNLEVEIILDFSHVETISPSFANEAFAYFMQYITMPEDFFKKIKIINIEKTIDLKTIEMELNERYHE